MLKPSMTDNEIIWRAKMFYGVSDYDFNANNRTIGPSRLAVKARIAAAEAMEAKGATLGHIARVLGYSGPSPVRYLITGKR